MTTNGIPAIETRYKGYRFRSRLEARWAIYFDHLGVEWDYEPEGFDLGATGWYVPDFWLSTVNMWAEVKPAPLSSVEYGKCAELALRSGLPVLMLVGTPDWKPYYAIRAVDGIIESGDYLLSAEYVHDERRFFSAPSGDEPICPGAEAAIAAARGARWGHGEVPHPPPRMARTTPVAPPPAPPPPHPDRDRLMTEWPRVVARMQANGRGLLALFLDETEPLGVSNGGVLTLWYRGASSAVLDALEASRDVIREALIAEGFPLISRVEPTGLPW